MPYPPAWDALRLEFQGIGVASGKVTQAWQNLTYTYIFDHFCHCLVGKDQYAVMRNAKGYPPLSRRSPKRADYFRDFFKKYLPSQPDQDRIDQFGFAATLNGPQDVYQQPHREIRNFFRRLHAVKSSENRAHALESIRTAPIADLQRLLAIIRNDAVGYDVRFNDALTYAKVPYIGESCVGEIFGWLMPNEYPILNDKFYDTLVHLGM